MTASLQNTEMKIYILCIWKYVCMMLIKKKWISIFIILYPIHKIECVEIWNNILSSIHIKGQGGWHNVPKLTLRWASQIKLQRWARVPNLSTPLGFFKTIFTFFKSNKRFLCILFIPKKKKNFTSYDLLSDQMTSQSQIFPVATHNLRIFQK